MTDLKQLTRDLVDQGKLIEAGWISLRIAAIDTEASRFQLEEMRMAFFAGAQHLFASIMTVLDPGGEEPTEADMDRIGLIDVELKKFGDDFAAKLHTDGSA